MVAHWYQQQFPGSGNKVGKKVAKSALRNNCRNWLIRANKPDLK